MQALGALADQTAEASHGDGDARRTCNTRVAKHRARVAHTRFGEGVVASVAGDGDMAKVRVTFADGEKC